MNKRKKSNESEFYEKYNVFSPPPESYFNAVKVARFRTVVKDLEDLKYYKEKSAKLKEEIEKAQKDFLKKSSDKRLKKYLQLLFDYSTIEQQHKRTDVEEYGKITKEFESIIDRKYWNIGDLFGIEFLLRCGRATTIEEAVSLYKEESQNDGNS